MARPHRVYQQLRDEHWSEFHSLLFRRNTTIDKLHRWLRARGYNFSRSAVGTYRRACWARGFMLGHHLAIDSEADAREVLKDAAANLPIEPLLSLGIYAALLLAQERFGQGSKRGYELLRPSPRRRRQR
jgi:hypothetical protein